MSLGARVVIAIFAALFGLVMCLVAPPTDRAPFFYGFGVFCFSIAVACIAKGRAAQFFGSVVGTVVFISGLAYLGHELWAGPLWSNSRSEPSVKNACLFLLVFGVPNVMYVMNAKFGFSRSAPQQGAQADGPASGGPAA